MRIGVVSDTHNNLKNVGRIVELFNAAHVDRVVHTGDITQARTLELFAHLRMPMVGVYGNNDLPEREALDVAIARHGFTFVEPPLRLLWHGRSIVVVHDPLEFEGHLDHATQLDAGRLTFNPGECAGHMTGYNAIGVVDLASLDVEILRF
jgi:hypothetical protein